MGLPCDCKTSIFTRVHFQLESSLSCDVAGKAPGPEVEAASRHEALTAAFEARRLGEGMGEDCLHLVTSFVETRNFEMARTVAALHWDIMIMSSLL